MKQESISPKNPRRTAAVVVFVIAVLSVLLIGGATLLDAYSKDFVPEDHVDVIEQGVDPFYMLLIGSDSRKGTALYTGKSNEHGQTEEHADIITLMRVDPLTYTITLVTVPRDTVLDGTDYKINDNLKDGDPTKVVSAVEKLTGVTVDSYMLIDFTSYEEFVNGIGGTLVDVPVTIKVTDPMTAKDVTVEAGDNQLLNGSESLVLARARKEYVTDQDALRQVNVRNLQVSILDSASVSQASLEDVLTLLESCTESNVDYAKMGPIALDFVAHKDAITIYSCTGPYDGGENKDGLWVIEEDKATWQDLMALVDSGEDPSGIVPLPQFPSSK